MFSRLDLGGKRILTTGASSGIGQSLAAELARHGARLALAARSLEPLRELARQIEAQGQAAVPIRADVTSASDRQALLAETVARLGGLDILINNAGIGASGFFDEAGEDRLRRIFEVNFFGAAELTRLAIPHLANGREPMVVNVSSVIGRRAIPGYAEYCSSKFALCGWSEALRAELVRQGIHLLLVCPGVIETPFRSNQLEDRLRAPWQNRRSMSPERCARIVVKAMRKRKNEVVITLGGKLLVLLNRWSPRLVDWVMANYLMRPASLERLDER